jgi:NTP pyrophosphatase (non-canonical NTP hydrolase)
MVILKHKINRICKSFSLHSLNILSYLERMSIKMVFNEDILKNSIKINGADNRTVVCMEEASELIQAVSKFYRGKGNLDNLEEEMADVYICLELIKLMYNASNSNIQDWINRKLTRQEFRDKSLEARENSKVDEDI